MAEPASYRPAPGTIPTQPGVYRFMDEEDRVLYVGKAKNLRARLANYFQDESGLSSRIRQMVHTATHVEWVVVGSEIEALTLEYSWIKEFEPRFNVVFRDNKSYPYLAVSLNEPYPRVWITRQKHRSGVRYFGPYAKVWAIRNILDDVLTAFPMRSCTKGQFNQAQRAGRPCLLGYIGKCVAPCVGKVDKAEYSDVVAGLVDFMDGDSSAAISTRKIQMQEAAQNQEFERAARLRDQVSALQTASQRNVVVFEENLDADIFGLEADEIEVSVQVFFVRGGRIRGQRGWISEEVGGLSMSEIVEELLLQVYGDAKYDEPVIVRSEGKSIDDRTHTSVGAIPAQIWVPALPPDAKQFTQWLSQRRQRPVALKVPQRGDKAKLAETVRENAVQALQRHKLARATDITVRSQALEELREGLDLDRAPLRIECYDISHTQGQHQVGSMVVFEDGLAKKADYRHFIVRGEDGTGVPDDTAAMNEVLHRRISRLLAGAPSDDAGGAEDVPETSDSSEDTEVRESTLSQTPRKFSYRPDLLVVDGGLPQVNAAQRAVDELGADIKVVGLAKRLEEVWVPGESFPVIFPRASPALRLLQQLRDESHRFAITFHRKKRGQAMTRSALDSVPGLGVAKQKALLKHFGSVAKIRAASVEELQNADGIGPMLAQAINENLTPSA